MPGPMSTPHGHTADGRRVEGKSRMKRLGVTSCFREGCNPMTGVERGVAKAVARIARAT